MNEKSSDSGAVLEIDLKRIAERLLHRLWLIVLVSILGAIVAFGYTYYFVTPQYQSAAMFYVNNGSVSLGDATISLSASDISASRGLVDTHIVILKARTTLIDIIDRAEVSKTPTELRKMISAAPVNSTEIFEVVVTGSDPYEVERIASAIADVLPKRIETIVEGSSAEVVDTAIVPTSPSSPSYSKNVVVGFILFMIGTVVVIVLRLLFDTTIRTEESVAQLTSYPVLVAVPDMNASSKGRYYSSYDANKSKDSDSTGKREALIGDEVSFVASEAYKLLRTKLQFSFTDEGGCRALGLSSAMAGEGKSLTSVNLAYSLAQLNKRVILIDCDMRRPTLAEKMKLRKTPGLSNWLTGQENISELLQRCSLRDGKGAFDVISAGQTPPNPVELLSSDKMAKTLSLLRKSYDYILLDLPPVGEVSDALAVANQVDGMLLVVRQDYCDRNALVAAVNQFEFIESKILGVVYNCASESTGRYGYKNYYKSYGKRSNQKAASSSKQQVHKNKPVDGETQ